MNQETLLILYRSLITYNGCMTLPFHLFNRLSTKRVMIVGKIKFKAKNNKENQLIMIIIITIIVKYFLILDLLSFS
jgi:hypothetical protein